MSGELRVVEIAAEATHPLRRVVLRTGTPSTSVVFDGDELATTYHLAAIDDRDAVVCVSTWLERPFPDARTRLAYQLRGMATDPARRGLGAGTAVLMAGLARCVDGGAALVWARARTSAVGFYATHGFEVVGDEFVDEATALPHRVIVRRL